MSSSQMAELIRTSNWVETPLGDMASWPSWLNTSVQIILDSRYPMFIWWGEHLVNIYNDAYIPMLGNRHPKALGACASKIWADIWEVIDPQVQTVFQEGRATWNEELPLFMSRYGFLEETFFSFSYSPIKNDLGMVLGLFCAVTEETGRVLKGRRLDTLRQISKVTERSESVEEVCRLVTDVLARNPLDIPFSVIYLWDVEERHVCLRAQSGFEPESPLIPDRLAVDGDHFRPSPWWPVSLLPRWQETGFPITGDVRPSGGAWPEPCRHGIVLPLQSWEREKKAGYLIVGTSTRLAVDERYHEFLNLLANGISSSINRAHALTEERKRNETLAELNRAKTEFFSNVSHEFRTPLTLILGSLEEAMHPTTFTTAPTLEVAQRNAVRMLKLVNTLLDFSSLEAGRMQAVFEPVDLGSLTNDLAASFESAMKKAGLEFIVACPPLSQPVYIDRNAWEKIILNLLSNALKFTLQGQVSLEVQQIEDAVHVQVKDSGVGISREALSRVFDRFFRAKEVLGRTFEGTGIGLSLVKELVTMHGGDIDVESTPGTGTVFTVTVPFGFRHLPSHQVRHTSSADRTEEALVESFILEAGQWMGPGGSEREETRSTITHTPQAPAPSRPVILLVEDNQDMRDYMDRLLRTQYDVVHASDGREALALARTVHPHLILSDVMMPRMDGFELLNHLRVDPAIQMIPVILISARAGQEAEVEGLLMGADDYLVKPFSARELLARVRKTLTLTTMRHAAIEYESRFHHLAHHPEVMTWMTDDSGNCIFLSQTWYAFTGQTDDTGLGSGWVDALHPDDRMSTQLTFQNAIITRNPVRMEYRLRRMDGEYHWMLDSASPRFGLDGRFAGFVGLVLDLSNQKETEEKIRESEERFRMLANTISQFAWMADSSGWIFWYNQRWFDYTGTTLEEMEGWGWQRVHHPDHVDRVVRKISQCFQTGQIWEDTFPLRSKNGEYRWFLSRAVPIRDDHGAVFRWMGTNTDITELKTTQEQFQELTVDLEKRIGERTQELEHYQMRLQALIGDQALTEQRERRRIAEELHDFLAQLLVACRLKVNRLEHMIEEKAGLQVLQEIDHLLDQSLNYTRSLVAQLIPAVLYQFGLLEALRWLAEDMKHHELSVNVQMERDHLGLAANEAGLIYQSVRELMLNVVKHAGVDTLRLRVTFPSSREVCIVVSDQGRGFDPTVLYDKAQPPNQFGIFSIRERVAFLGGRLAVDSSPGSGTRISLYVPIPAQDQDEEAVVRSQSDETGVSGDMRDARPPPSSDVRVVLADDHAVVRQGLRSLLDSFPDVQVVGEAANGLEAVRLVEALRPDVVVMDVNMPHLDGIEATRRIVQNYSGVLVIGLSVRQDKETELAMRAAGAKGYLTKESAGLELHQLIATIVQQHKG